MQLQDTRTQDPRPNLDEEIIRDLRRSHRQIGPLHKVVKTQFGIAVGLHRKRAASDWPEDHREVASYYEHLKLRAHGNVQRRVAREETQVILLEAARELMKQGTPPSQIATRLARDFPWNRQWILKLLPEQYKQPSKVNAGQASTRARLNQGKKSGTEDPQETNLREEQFEAEIQRLRRAVQEALRSAAEKEELLHQKNQEIAELHSQISQRPAQQPLYDNKAGVFYLTCPQCQTPLKVSLRMRGAELAPQIMLEPRSSVGKKAR